MEKLICDQFTGDIEKFEQWVKSQTQLPQNINKLLLLRYLKVCDFDHEKATKLLLSNLELREQNSHLFTNRDVRSEGFKKAMNTVQVCPLPTYTDQKHKVTIFRLKSADPGDYNVVEMFKMVFMNSDIRYITPDSIGLTEGEIGIMDFSHFSFRHFLKIVANFSTVRLYLRYVQETVPFKIHQNHFVNCSSMLTKIINLIRPLVKKELFDVMYFHTSSYDSLYEHVSKEILPFEYGGKAGAIDDLYEDWMKVVKNHRDYLNDDLNWKLSI